MTQFDFQKLSVLAVDDNRYMLRLLQMILQSMDVHDVHCLQNPDEAMSEIERSHPHLVITDLLMQPIDGVTLTKIIRMEREPICFTPVLVLSGFTDAEHVLQASEAGAHHVLAKPVTTGALYKQIVTLIEDERPFFRTNNYFGPERRKAQTSFEGPQKRAPVDDDDTLVWR